MSTVSSVISIGGNNGNFPTQCISKKDRTYLQQLNEADENFFKKILDEGLRVLKKNRVSYIRSEYWVFQETLLALMADNVEWTIDEKRVLVRRLCIELKERSPSIHNGENALEELLLGTLTQLPKEKEGDLADLWPEDITGDFLRKELEESINNWKAKFLDPHQTPSVLIVSSSSDKRKLDLLLSDGEVPPFKILCFLGSAYYDGGGSDYRFFKKLLKKYGIPIRETFEEACLFGLKNPILFDREENSPYRKGSLANWIRSCFDILDSIHIGGLTEKGLERIIEEVSVEFLISKWDGFKPICESLLKKMHDRYTDKYMQLLATRIIQLFNTEVKFKRTSDLEYFVKSWWDVGREYPCLFQKVFQQFQKGCEYMLLFQVCPEEMKKAAIEMWGECLYNISVFILTDYQNFIANEDGQIYAPPDSFLGALKEYAPKVFDEIRSREDLHSVHVLGYFIKQEENLVKRKKQIKTYMQKIEETGQFGVIRSIMSKLSEELEKEKDADAFAKAIMRLFPKLAWPWILCNVDDYIFSRFERYPPPVETSPAMTKVLHVWFKAECKDTRNRRDFTQTYRAIGPYISPLEVWLPILEEHWHHALLLLYRWSRNDHYPAVVKGYIRKNGKFVLISKVVNQMVNPDNWGVVSSFDRLKPLLSKILQPEERAVIFLRVVNRIFLRVDRKSIEAFAEFLQSLTNKTRTQLLRVLYLTRPNAYKVFIRSCVVSCIKENHTISLIYLTFSIRVGVPFKELNFSDETKQQLREAFPLNTKVGKRDLASMISIMYSFENSFKFAYGEEIHVCSELHECPEVMVSAVTLQLRKLLDREEDLPHFLNRICIYWKARGELEEFKECLKKNASLTEQISRCCRRDVKSVRRAVDTPLFSSQSILEACCLVDKTYHSWFENHLKELYRRSQPSDSSLRNEINRVVDILNAGIQQVYSPWSVYD